MRSGKPFEYEVRRSLALLDDKIFWCRMFDTQDYVAINPRIKVPHQPCDFIFAYKGRLALIEAKSTHANRFSFKYLKPEQEESLTRAEDRGCLSFLFISKRVKKGSLCVAVPIRSYLALKQIFENEGHKSVPFNDLYRAGYRLKRVSSKSGTAWDLSPLLNLMDQLGGFKLGL